MSACRTEREATDTCAAEATRHSCSTKGMNPPPPHTRSPSTCTHTM